MFIVQNGKVSPGFLVGRIFWGVRRLCRFLGDSPKGLRRRCISWGFPRWGIEWIFCILRSGCHYLTLLYLLVCFFIISFIYLFIFWLALIRHIRFCWCELCEFKLTWNKELHYITIGISDNCQNRNEIKQKPYKVVRE